MSNIMDRKEALELVKRYNRQDSLVKHALAVEAVMRHFAGIFSADNPDDWALVGLLHDLDYGTYPEEHCTKTKEILDEIDFDPVLTRAIISHGYGICSDVEPVTDMEKVLYTIDELTGLVTATVLMRPSRSVLDLTLKSLKKKYKSPSFAAGVDRSIIENGAAMLGWELDRVLSETIKGMQTAATELQLDGSLATQ